MKICIVVGTRPEIIKASLLIKLCETRKLDYFVLHTGQHYSYEMDKIFFEELELPPPKYNLNIGSRSHGEQTGAMLDKIEKVLVEERPHIILTIGDTNSVIAGALAAAKLHIRIGHIEAGLRSDDRAMAEEQNRIVVDHLSDYLFAPTQLAAKNLLGEGIPPEKIFVVGNPIVDVVRASLVRAQQLPLPAPVKDIERKKYALVTIHRPENVDDLATLQDIITGLGYVRERITMPIVFPIHPRTKKRLAEFKIMVPSGIVCIDPVGYFEFLRLLADAALIVTDSGGIQEEAAILQVPCVTTRTTTERQETLEIGANRLAGTVPELILEKTLESIRLGTRWENPYGDGTSSEKIIKIILEKLSQPTISVTDQSKLAGVLRRAREWILYSGIQNIDSKHLEVKGGFNSWYDLDQHNYFYTYSEITGYGITILLFLYSLEKNPLYLQRAILAAEWLLDKASHKSGGVKTRYYLSPAEKPPELYDFSSGIIHSFDNGIVLNGLIDLYTVTKEERYLSLARHIGDLLVTLMQKGDGSVYASYSHQEESFKDSNEKWSTQSGSFHAKISFGLLKLSEVTKERRYRDAVVKLCNFALKLQQRDGRFISYVQEKDTHLHSHCYSAEGLLIAGLSLGDDRYLQSAALATRWALNIMLQGGGVPCMYVNNESILHERSDVVAQVLRLSVVLRSLGLIDQTDDKKMDLLSEHLFTFQCRSGSSQSDGGFLYGTDVNYRDNLSLNKKNHVNSWCTMFATQALIYFDHYKSGIFKFDKNFFV